MNKTTTPHHTIILITYNQEDLIERALDSLLCQKEFIYEIVVSDDCSTDKTWEIIQTFKNRYPEIIRPFQNSHNLGIFGNIESTWSKPTGDIIWYLSGDDVYCKGLFEEANKLIKKHNIDFINEAFTLYFDYKAITPNGEETVFKNNLVEKYNPISLKIRNLICNRTTGVSRKVFEKFHPVRKDIGIMADGLIDIQTQLFSDKSFYSRFVGSAYYTNIGISSVTKRRDKIRSGIMCLEQYKIDIKYLTKNDLSYINYMQAKLTFILNPNCKTYKLFLVNYLNSISHFISLRLMFRELMFAFKYVIRIIFNIYFKK
jgi:glycosyltransferase involved in cell wall biosynthesis